MVPDDERLRASVVIQTKNFARQTRNLIEPDKVTAWIIGVSKSLSKSVDRFLGRLVSLVVALQPHLKVWAFSSTEEGLVPPERARPRLILVVFSPEFFYCSASALALRTTGLLPGY